jgi:ribose-phosphate pyrophosphokinase
MAASQPKLSMKYEQMSVFCGNANPALTADVCECLGIQPGLITAKTFADGELQVQILENVRGVDVFAIQPTCNPVERNLFELLLMIDALKRASAERITAVLPYYGYARQDRKDKPRVPISAKLIASLLERAGADRVLSLDLHAAQIQGFFDIPVDHLFAAPVMIEHFRSAATLPNITVVSPDAGGVERARAFAKRLNAPLAIIDKRREQANVAEIMNIIGEVRGRNCIMVDDLIDTAGTLVKGAEALIAEGAVGVSACATHAVLSGQAVKRIEESPIKEVVVTNSIPLREEARRCDKIRQLSVAPLLARAIQSIHDGGSISTLFV